jgi:hypothetical protein
VGPAPAWGCAAAAVAQLGRAAAKCVLRTRHLRRQPHSCARRTAPATTPGSQHLARATLPALPRTHSRPVLHTQVLRVAQSNPEKLHEIVDTLTNHCITVRAGGGGVGGCCACTCWRNNDGAAPQPGMHAPSRLAQQLAALRPVHTLALRDPPSPLLQHHVSVR